MVSGRSFILLLLVFSVEASVAQSRMIKVHFLYGSVPKRKFRTVEEKRFGGIHGGHVMIEMMDGKHYGFNPCGKFHVFGSKKSFHSCFRAHNVDRWAADTGNNKYTTFIIPVSGEQYALIDSLHRRYLSSPPYDYAFFGMRCAAASYDLLAQAGLVKRYGRHRTVLRFFYPKLLRKKLIRLAESEGYERVSHPGSPGRRWEKDSFL